MCLRALELKWDLNINFKQNVSRDKNYLKHRDLKVIENIHITQV